MKKLALILALMLIPCSAFGLEMLADSALDDVTGQAGVSIAADDVQLFLNVERFAWIDSDGYQTGNSYGGEAHTSIGGAFFIDNFQMDVININMIGGRGTLIAWATSDLSGSGGVQTANANALGGSDSGVIDLFYDYGNTNTMGSLLTGSYALAGQTLGLDNYTNINQSTSNAGVSPFLTKSITIDATAKLPLHSVGWWANDVNHLTGGDPASSNTTGSQSIGGVIIGFPTMEIYINQMVVTPRFTSQITANATSEYGSVTNRCFNEGQSYGTFEMQGITFSVLSGWMEIAPTGALGDGY